nr:F-actin-capping protein subunit alpha-1-like [Lytechinus pictus]
MWVIETSVLANKMSDFEPISDAEKVKIASDFITHAPPGEFSEVFNDVRILINNDHLLSEAGESFAKYNKDQFTPASIDGVERPALVTQFNDLPNGRFLDPDSKQTFKFDHMRKVVTDVEHATNIDTTSEPWRIALSHALAGYIKDHFPNGNSAAYGRSKDKKVILVACIEHHLFQPANFWNGRWRSQWTVTFDPSCGSVEAGGLIKVQVHYYEDGNVQLVSHKEVKFPLEISTPENTAAAFVKAISHAEEVYQSTLTEDYGTMSDTTFKALRRALPITKTKVDWKQISQYDIGKKLNQSQ